MEFEVAGLSGDVIGTVQWDFLEKLLEESSAFYLAGRAWLVERIEWKNKCIIVVPSPVGIIPNWGGINPSFLSYEICRQMQDIFINSEHYPYLDPDAAELLESIRFDRQSFLSSAFAPIAYDEKSITWWTWAGGNINNTLRTVFYLELNTDVQVSNEYIKIKNGFEMLKKFKDTIIRVSKSEYWENPELLRRIHSLVPNYHLSKFQPYLPEELRLKLIADTIFDIGGTIAFLREMGRSSTTINVLQ